MADLKKLLQEFEEAAGLEHWADEELSYKAWVPYSRRLEELRAELYKALNIEETQDVRDK